LFVGLVEGVTEEGELLVGAPLVLEREFVVFLGVEVFSGAGVARESDLGSALAGAAFVTTVGNTGAVDVTVVRGEVVVFVTVEGDTFSFEVRRLSCSEGKTRLASILSDSSSTSTPTTLRVDEWSISTPSAESPSSKVPESIGEDKKAKGF
jgi:hypothetical protein